MPFPCVPCRNLTNSHWPLGLTKQNNQTKSSSCKTIYRWVSSWRYSAKAGMAGQEWDVSRERSLNCCEKYHQNYDPLFNCAASGDARPAGTALHPWHPSRQGVPYTHTETVIWNNVKCVTSNPWEKGMWKFSKRHFVTIEATIRDYKAEICKNV